MMTQELHDQIIEALAKQTEILNQISIILERLTNVFYPTGSAEPDKKEG